jgi:hypothetical protein
MFNLINEFLWRCVKRLFTSIKDDCINDLIGWGIIFFIIMISIFVSALVNNNKISFIIIVSIVVTIFSLVLFYKGKK